MRSFFLVALLALAIAGNARAQRLPVGERSPPSSKIGEGLAEGVAADAKNTRRLVQDFARCLTRTNLTGVGKFLENDGVGLTPALRRQAPDCLGNSAGDGSMLRGRADTYRIAMAEAYLVRKYRGIGLGDLALVAPLVHAGETGPNGAHGLGTLGECIVRQSPVESWALLQTDAASAEEKSQFATLGPAMQTCVKRGTTIKMQAFFMRGAIAQTYYQLSRAPRLAPGAAR